MENYNHVSCDERRIIYHLKRSGQSIREISRTLERAPSTISREIKRNKGGMGYNCYEADHRAKGRRTNASRSRKKITQEHWAFIMDCLDKRFSPEQIAALFPEQFHFQVAPSSIYRWIYRYHDGGKFNLKKRLRRKGKPYRRGQKRSNLPERTFIDERPESVKNRVFYGDWEADLMLDGRHTQTALLVLVERKSRYTIIRRVPNRKSNTVASAMKKMLNGFRVRTITYDNGSEFARFEEVENASKSKAYFCHPYSAWEKGLVENTIGLIREYIPKRSKVRIPDNQASITQIQKSLNLRPRKSIGFKTPANLVSKLLT